MQMLIVDLNTAKFCMGSNRKHHLTDAKIKHNYQIKITKRAKMNDETLKKSLNE